MGIAKNKPQDNIEGRDKVQKVGIAKNKPQDNIEGIDNIMGERSQMSMLGS